MPQSSGQFKFAKNQSIGAMDAEHDGHFLDDCFVDTGDLKAIANVSSPQCIILGRTGSGKSALLAELTKHASSRGGLVIQIHPEDLSFNYISNSILLRDLESLSVNLDPFFKLLWKHVFAVSIFQARFGMTDEQTQNRFMTWLLESPETKTKRRQEEANKQKAVAYVQRWGNKFWEASDVRVKEIVMHFEEEVRKGLSSKLGGEAKVGINGLGIGFTASNESTSGDNAKQSFTVTAEGVDAARRVINEIQARELTGILELVAEVLPDPQKPCFIIIDRLDEAWAEDKLRMRLMKALLESVSQFRSVKNGKIVLCLRVDLLEQIFREMRNEPGFQEEKYTSLYMPLVWTDSQLELLLDMRIGRLVRDAFTTYSPKARDLLPESLSNKRKSDSPDGLEYMLRRTWRRPRDLIEFFNLCIKHGAGRTKIDKATLLLAEGEYSQSRLKSIGTEWEHLYPGLAILIHHLLANRPAVLALTDWTDYELLEWADVAMNLGAIKTGPLVLWATSVISDSAYDAVRERAASLFYKAGIIGLRLRGQPVQWADNMSLTVSPSEIRSDTKMVIHEGLWRTLGVRPS